jgi:hypothetical protein
MRSKRSNSARIIEFGQLVEVVGEDLLHALGHDEDRGRLEEKHLLRIGVLDIDQPSTLGGLWAGQAAQVTGTDAANDVVADFTGTVQSLSTSPSIAVPVLATHSITLGSTFKCQTEGIWNANASVMAQTAASVRIGIGLDNVVGDLSIDPVVTTRTLDVKLSISAGADTVPLNVDSSMQGVTRNQANDPTLGIWRLLMSNNAGAGAADAAVLVALTSLRIRRAGNLPRALRNG